MLIPSQEPGFGHFVCRALSSAEPHTRCGLGCHLRPQPHGDSPTDVSSNGPKNTHPHPLLRGYSEVEKGLVLRLKGRSGRKGSSPEGVLGRDLAQLPSLGASSRLLEGAPPTELSCGAGGRGGHSRVRLGPASRFEVRGISSTWLDVGTRHTVHKAHQKP